MDITLGLNTSTTMILGIYQGLHVYCILRWYTKGIRGVTDPSNAHWTRANPILKNNKGTFKNKISLQRQRDGCPSAIIHQSKKN